MGAFVLGTKSRFKLQDLRENPRRAVERAIALTVVDFTVGETLRTKERQAQLVSVGASRTMESKHLTGEAVDLWAWVDGAVRWDWPLYYHIARAMREAAIELDMPITWGGAWDRDIRYLSEDLGWEVEQYVTRWRERNPDKKRNPLIDGPHFEARSIPVEA